MFIICYYALSEQINDDDNDDDDDDIQVSGKSEIHKTVIDNCYKFVILTNLNDFSVNMQISCQSDIQCIYKNYTKYRQ